MTATDSELGVTFINALMDGRIGSLRVQGSVIASIDQNPQRGDRIVDLRGDRLLPGLINAHDHLQLNNLPALEASKRYRHVKQWIDDIILRRRTDPDFEARVTVARDARLFIGGIKNLLGGATTVAHHDPLYPSLCLPDFPVAVLANYGWSHSLYIESEFDVSRACRATPDEWPWIIHAAEGLDEDAAAEFERLDSLSCIQANTVLVHGVALDQAQRRRLRRAQGALVWCPSSNLRLFGKTADVEELAAYGRVALGTDSRLSGSNDLLEELNLAGQSGRFDDAALESLVTSSSARILKLKDRGVLQVGLRADLLILPAAALLSNSTRADVRLIIVNGEARYGDADYAGAHSPQKPWTPIRVDGRRKVLLQRIAAQLSRLSATEEGLVLPDRIEQAA